MVVIILACAYDLLVGLELLFDYIYAFCEKCINIITIIIIFYMMGFGQNPKPKSDALHRFIKIEFFIIKNKYNGNTN
jgi:hypothetical protein